MDKKSDLKKIITSAQSSKTKKSSDEAETQAMRNFFRSKMKSCDCQMGRSVPDPPYIYKEKDPMRDYFNNGCPLIPKTPSGQKFKATAPCDCIYIDKVDKKKKKKFNRPKKPAKIDTSKGILKYLDPSFRTENPNYQKTFDLPDDELIKNEINYPDLSYTITDRLEPKIPHKVYPLEVEQRKKMNDLNNFVKMRKTPDEQKQQELLREERIMQEREALGYRMMTPRTSFQIQVSSVDSPVGSKTTLVGEDAQKRAVPKPASRSPSETLPFIQSPELLDLKRPRSGIFINETREPRRPEDLEPLKPPPYKVDPRKLQSLIDQGDEEFYISDIDGEMYAIPEKHYPVPPKPFRPCPQSSTEQINFNKELDVETGRIDLPKNIPRTSGNVKSNLVKQKLELGHPVGILVGSFNKNDNYFPEKSRKLQGIACIYMAFAMSYIDHETEWTSQVVNEIIIEGNRLYLESTEDGKKPDNPILRKFEFKGAAAEVSHADADIMGQIDSYDLKVCSLYHGLKMFFKFNPVAIFESGSCQLLIWKKKAFFVFDPNGRTNHAEFNNETGGAALITLVHLENVVYLISKMSGLTAHSPFKLSQLQIVKLFELPEPVQQSAARKPPIIRTNEYKVWNNQHAILYGKYHIGDNIFGDHRNKQSLSTSIAAIVYSKIDPPNTWNRKILHKVLLLGDKFYERCIREHGQPIIISLRDVPAIFRLGLYETKICITPFIFNCTIKPDNIRDATKFLKRYFLSNRYALVQIKSAVFSIWLRNDFYYLFDPFKRAPSGLVPSEKCGAACLHMFSRVYDLCQLLFKNLLRIAPDENFYLHALQIMYLKERKSPKKAKGKKSRKGKKGHQCECIEEDDEEDDFEIPEYATEQVLQDSELNAEVVSLQDSINEYLNEKPTCHDVPIDKDKAVDLNEIALAETQYPEPYSVIRKEFYEPVGADGTFILSESEDSESSDDDYPLTSFLSCTDITKKRILEMEQIKRKKTSLTTVAICKDMVEEIFDAFNEEIAECEYEYDESGAVIRKISPLMPPKAKKILIKSDLDYLNQLKQRAMYAKDPVKSKEPIVVKKISLMEELKIPSNFIRMPDQSQLLFGTKCIYDMDFPFGLDQMNALVGIAALISSYKYSIATWDHTIVNFTLDVSAALGQQVPVNQAIIYSAARFRFGNVRIGSKVYSITLKNIATGIFVNLYKILETIFETYDRVVIITTCDSFSVFKRYNFYYLYEGYPCDVVGFRTSNAEVGKACFMRFLSLTALVRRIESNRVNCTMNHRIGVSCVIMTEVKEDELKQYVRRTESMEQILLQQLKNDRIKRRDDRRKRINMLNDEIASEKKRIKKFRADKRRLERIRARREANTEGEGEYMGEEEETYYAVGSDIEDADEDEDEDEDDESQAEPDDFESSDEEPSKHPKKHILGSNLIETGDPVYKDQVECINELGYSYRPDNLYKIQGTFALNERSEIVYGKYKACFYVGIYALLYVIHHPISTFNYRKVDIILENGLNLSNDMKCRRISKKIEIRKVLVDKYNYYIIMKQYEINNPFSRLTLEIAIDTYFQKKKYLLLQFDNCTFVIYKDEMYHLFDPYPAMETYNVKVNKEFLIKDDEEPPENVKTYSDRNTASWVLFSSLPRLISYILCRLVNPEDLNRKYNMYTMFIVKYERAPKKSQYNQFLLNEVLPGREHSMRCPTENDIIEVEPEKILWIENITMLPWNRIQNHNIMGQTRKSPITMYKEFDIEIPYELYSLFSTLHPTNPNFEKRCRGKQYMATCVISCLMAHLYKLNDWNSQLMDEIVNKGDTYFRQSTADISVKNYQMSLEDLNPTFLFDTFLFNISIQAVAIGILYDTRLEEFNLSRGLTYFFEKNRYGILQCNGRVLAIGKGIFGYFMYDCQSYGPPVFKSDMGSTYILKCSSMKRLLHSIILALNVTYHRVEFSLHSINMDISRDFEKKVEISEVKLNEMYADSTAFKDETEEKVEEEDDYLSGSRVRPQPDKAPDYLNGKDPMDLSDVEVDLDKCKSEAEEDIRRASQSCKTENPRASITQAEPEQEPEPAQLNQPEIEETPETIPADPAPEPLSIDEVGTDNTISVDRKSDVPD